MRKLVLFLIAMLAICACASAEEPEFTGYATVVVSDEPVFTINLGDREEVYLPLDDLGRVQGAAAVIGISTVPMRSVINSIRPTGWQQANYPFISGLNLYNRSHMIAHQMGGDDSAENIFTGTQYLNITAMKPIEDFVVSYVQRTGSRVRYEVRPYFIGEDLVCRGVFISAASLDDEELRISVFCFNVQPGVAIDYSNGLSMVAPVSASIEMPEEMSRAMPEDPDEPVVTYVLNTSRKRFHRPDCQSVLDIKPENRQDFYGTREELIDQGYQPCGNCHP